MSFLQDFLPRRFRIGPLVLDLFHRDARVDTHWLALHPREFALLWRLGEARGGPVSRQTLLRDVWRLRHTPDTNSVEVHIHRLRTKLAARDLQGLVQTLDGGGYRIAAPPDAFGPGLAASPHAGARSAPPVRAVSGTPDPKAGLDSYLLLGETGSTDKEDRYDCPDDPIPHDRARFD